MSRRPLPPAGHGCPVSWRPGLGMRMVNEGREQEMGDVTRPLEGSSHVLSGFPTELQNEQGCMHLSRPRSCLRRWRSCSRLFPARLAPLNHYEPGSDNQSSQKTEALVQIKTTTYKLPLFKPSLTHPPPSSILDFLVSLYPYRLPMQYKLSCQRGFCDVANLPL